MSIAMGIADRAVSIAERLDEIGKPAWIALMVLGFMLFWPVGLATLFFLIWSGRMGCWKHSRMQRWHERAEQRTNRWYGEPPSSGNRAFDEYRAATLRRLEEEQREFTEFLGRLRFAKDKAEFDEFLADRRRRAQQGPEPQPQG